MDANKVLSQLAHVCAGFFKQQSWNDLILRIVQAGIESTGSERGTIFLSTDVNSARKQNMLSSIIATGVDGKVLRIEDHKGIAGYVFREQRPIIINDAHADPRFDSQIDHLIGYKTKSLLCVPLRLPNDKPIGCIEFLNSKAGGFTHLDEEVAQILALFASIALEQRFELYDLKSRNEQLKEDKARNIELLQHEEKFLKTNHPKLLETYKKLKDYAKSESSILIYGEGGTGKELVARYIHKHSPHAEGPFVAVNCAAIPESLFEAELLGVKAGGTATGGIPRKGKMELANEGTLFLDEVGEMPLSVQSKLLRVLQDKIIAPLGSDAAPTYVDFRIVAATNKNLLEMVEKGEFRDDLYYRLSVINMNLPPLRERKEDLESICEEILVGFAVNRGWKKKSLGQGALQKIYEYSWPGNIRELQNKLESACIQSGESMTLKSEHIHLSLVDSFIPSTSKVDNLDKILAPDNVVNLKEAKDRAEKFAIEAALKKTEGNKTKAAHLLDISREGLRKAMKKHKVV